MISDQDPRFFVWGGVSGVLGTLCYFAAVVIPLSDAGTFALIMAWPVLSIVFAFSMFRFLGRAERSAANQLAFLFNCLAFTMVSVMLSSQLAVGAGMLKYTQDLSPDKHEFVNLIRQSVRLVDLGIDVAWDVFIGTGLIFLAFALKGNRDFGLWWGIPAGLLAVVLIVLNVITFPWPPDTRDMFDVGPIIAIFIIALSVRLIVVGHRMRQTPATHIT